MECGRRPYRAGSRTGGANLGLIFMPRPVQISDVAPYAKRNCRRCHGRGVQLANNLPTACPCAATRFLRERGDEVSPDQRGDVWWREEESIRAGIVQGLVFLRSFVKSFFCKSPTEGR
jgi:hypothetical protein